MNAPINEPLGIIRTLDLKMTGPLIKKRALLSVDDLMELLKFLYTTTYFVFRGQVYRQRFGAGMGSPVSVNIAEFCMEFSKQKSHRILPPSITTP